jgi:AraC-like DNA-binding protein
MFEPMPPNSHAGQEPATLPVGTLKTQLAALASLGLDAAAIEHAIAARFGALPLQPETPVSSAAFGLMWQLAQHAFGRPGLPTAVAMAVPFGAFGAIDYLAGSADTVAGCVASVQLHMTLVAHDTQLDVAEHDNGSIMLSARCSDAGSAVAEEFTLAMMVSRLRTLTDGAVAPQQIVLRAPRAQDDDVRPRLYAAPLLYAQPGTHAAYRAADWTHALRSRDPYLHETLRRLAGPLRLDTASPMNSAGQGSKTDRTDLERALRARLRDALATGDAAPERLARLLGLSERTLQRRLAELGRSYSAIVEDFRREEAAFLLADKRHAVTDVAAQLGYAEQTSFTRAFRRWTGTTPAAWRRQQVQGTAAA